jgi:hypothetical protein
MLLILLHKTLVDALKNKVAKKIFKEEQQAAQRRAKKNKYNRFR